MDVAVVALGVPLGVPQVEYWSRVQVTRRAFVDNVTICYNRPFYSCLLSDLAYEWLRGCR